MKGNKLALKSDESFLFWHPAPPKWDVAPSKVMQHLFPDYHGAALGLEGEDTFADSSDDNSEDERAITPEEAGDISENSAIKRFVDARERINVFENLSICYK